MAPRTGVISSSATTAQQLAMDAASGAYRIRLDTSYDVTWSLGTVGNTPPLGVCLGYAPTERYKGLCFQLDSGARTLLLQPTWVTTGVNALYVPVSNDGGTYAGTQPVYTNFMGNFAGNGANGHLDGGFNLQGGEKPIGTLQTVLRWQSASAQNPPNAAAPK